MFDLVSGVASVVTAEFGLGGTFEALLDLAVVMYFAAADQAQPLSNVVDLDTSAPVVVAAVVGYLVAMAVAAPLLQRGQPVSAPLLQRGQQAVVGLAAD